MSKINIAENDEVIKFLSENKNNQSLEAELNLTLSLSSTQATSYGLLGPLLCQNFINLLSGIKENNIFINTLVLDATIRAYYNYTMLGQLETMNNHNFVKKLVIEKVPDIEAPFQSFISNNNYLSYLQLNFRAEDTDITNILEAISKRKAPITFDLSHISGPVTTDLEYIKQKIELSEIKNIFIGITEGSLKLNLEESNLIINPGLASESLETIEKVSEFIIYLLTNNKLKSLSENKNLAHKLIKDLKTSIQEGDVNLDISNQLLELARSDGNLKAILPFIIASSKGLFKVLVNSKDANGSHFESFANGNLAFIKKLMEFGYITKLAEKQDQRLLKIMNDKESVHDAHIVKLTNFTIKELLAKTDITFQIDIVGLFEAVKTILLDEETKFIFKFFKPQDLHNAYWDMSKAWWYNTEPKIFIEHIFKKVINKLKDVYLTEQFGQYNYAPGTDSVITITESLNAIISFIIGDNISHEQMKNLCAKSLIKYLNLEKSSKKQYVFEENKANLIEHIKIQANATSFKGEVETINDFKKLLEKAEISFLDNLVKATSKISMAEFDMINKINKIIVLAKYLFIAATERGEDFSCCFQGTITQIMAAFRELDYTILDLFEVKEQKESSSKITSSNSHRITDSLATFLSNKFKENLDLSSKWQDFAIDFKTNLKSGKFGFEEQQIIALINNFLFDNIKTYIPLHEEMFYLPEFLEILEGPNGIFLNKELWQSIAENEENYDNNPVDLQGDHYMHE